MPANNDYNVARRRAGLWLALTGGLLSLLALPGCTANPELAGAAFVDPGRYALYNCQQLETERVGVTKREAELRGLIEKAGTGFGGPVVAEAAYGSDYASERQKLQAIDAAQTRSRCPERGLR